uniref:Uncharacterized protein n=1 Tax=Ditylenchus dipsaci TaxID=166011 RepID=A0A915DYY7_9BILA
MDKAFFAMLKLMKLIGPSDPSSTEYNDFLVSIKLLLQEDGQIHRRKIAEEFALVDYTGYLFNIIAEGFNSFHDTTSLESESIVLSFHLMYYLSSKQLLAKMDTRQKLFYSTSIRAIFQEDVRQIFTNMAAAFHQRRGLDLMDIVSVGFVIFCTQIRLSMMFEVINEDDLWLITHALDMVPKIWSMMTSLWFFFLLIL